MTDEPTQVRVAPEVPVIFSDGASNHWYGANVSKIILGRYDPAFGPSTNAKEVTVAQLVMPNDSLIMTVAFLEHRLRTMIAAGIITQAQVDTSRKFWLDNPEAGKNA